MLNEVKNSVKARLYDSTYTPFMGSYILSWLFINHLYVLTYFGNFKDKISLLKQYDFGLLNFNMWLTPLIFALIYIYIYPYFLKKFYKYTLKQQKERNDIKQEVEDKKLLTIEQSREVRLAQYKLEEEIDKKDKKIEYFKSEIQTLENEKSKIEENVFKKLSVKEDEIRLDEDNKCKKSIELFRIELDKSSLQLKNKSNEVEENKIIHQKLKYDIDEQNNLIVSLENNIEELTGELNTIKQQNEHVKDAKYKEFLKEFSNDEIVILETIYKHSITNHNDLNSYVSIINTYCSMPKAKIEMILKSLKQKDLVTLNKDTWKHNLTETGKNKVISMFG